MLASDEKEKAFFTIEKIKNEAVRPEALPSFGQCVQIIRTLSQQSEKAKIHDFAKVILQDPALTTRTLRIANSIEYNRSGKRISTVSQAILILGMKPIRSIAYSVLLMEDISNSKQANIVRNAGMLSVTAGSLGRVIAEKSQLDEPESGFISGAFSNFGSLLLATFMPLEAEEIQRLIHDDNISEDDASRQVIGMRVEQLGKEIGEFLGLPSEITSYMDPVHISERDKEGLDDKLLSVTRVSHKISRAIVNNSDVSVMERAIKAINPKDEGLGDIDFFKSLKEAVSKMEKFYSPGMGVAIWDKIQAVAKSELRPASEEPVLEEAKDPINEELCVLKDGVMTSTEMLANPNTDIQDVLGAIAEALFLGMQARNVVIGSISKDRSRLIGYASFGPDANALQESFNFPLASGPLTLAKLTLQNGKDLIIDNPEDPKLAHHIPSWIKSNKPKSFMLLPIMAKELPFGLIYVDSPQVPLEKQKTDEMQREMRLLKNQAILAMRLEGIGDSR
ncbi:MAG: HDOD domain-containing protein [Verrucomicrobiota bacterium]